MLLPHEIIIEARHRLMLGHHLVLRTQDVLGELETAARGPSGPAVLDQALHFLQHALPGQRLPAEWVPGKWNPPEWSFSQWLDGAEWKEPATRNEDGTWNVPDGIVYRYNRKKKDVLEVLRKAAELADREGVCHRPECEEEAAKVEAWLQAHAPRTVPEPVIFDDDAFAPTHAEQLQRVNEIRGAQGLAAINADGTYDVSRMGFGETSAQILASLVYIRERQERAQKKTGGQLPPAV